jgi:adenylate cyclase
LNPLHPRPRTLRLASGLILLAYVATHLLNHALGLVSLAAAETGREVFVAFWRSVPATAAFYGALLLHFGLALAALYERRSLRMPWLEFARIALGFAIPLLLAYHMVQTRLAWELTGTEDNYRRIVASMWANDFTIRQFAMVAIVWLHACFGLHLAYRHRAGWRRWQSSFVAVATLLPVLAFTGYLAMARETATLPPAPPVAPHGQERTLELATDVAFYLPLALLALTLAARWAQVAWARRSRNLVQITYPSQSVEVPVGFSVLEASRTFGIPHMSLCGGRARCSTCRIEVRSSAAPLPPPNADEAATLARIGAPPSVRLACQLRPSAAIDVRPLALVRTGPQPFESWVGPEREVVVLFCDLRRWTGLSEQHLPFDLVYVLDQFFEAVGDAVREAGGIPNQFIGDSVMALFGVETDTASAARQALVAAESIERRMAALNESLAAEFRRPLDFGIGIHAGTAAIGTVGYRDTRTLSAVGDAVNTASRLQGLTKTLKVRVIVSEAVMLRAGTVAGDWQRHELEIRGRTGKLTVYALPSFCPATA